MATQMSFGAILREARERRGLDLTTAARRLRIRPDILRAIEENDFSRMPPRGYTRNMVNAYAPARGTQSHGADPHVLGRGLCLSGGPRPQRGRSHGLRHGRLVAPGAARPQREKGRTGDPTAAPERARPHPLRRPHRFGRPATLCAGPHASRHAAVPGTQYTNFYAGPKAPAQARSKLPFVIAAAVILVVLVVVLVLVFGNKGASEQDVPSVPITGLTDTSNPDDGAGDGAAQTPPTPIAPDKVVFSFSVASGTEKPTSRSTKATAGRASPRTWRGRPRRADPRHHHAQVRHDQTRRT